MPIREERVAGLDALGAATRLLHRARLADAETGIWEADDLQWWWRTPRPSDTIEQSFWFDDEGPVAAAIFTDWGRCWGFDPLVLPDASPHQRSAVWSRGLDLIDARQLPCVEVLARDDDTDTRLRLTTAGFVATGERSGTTWMQPGARPAVPALPDGFRLVDRAHAEDRPHPMRPRNGNDVEGRLRQCSLYDPELDVGIVAPNGDSAGYALFWNDTVTGVGLLEPMRVEDAYQRRGLARALLAVGLDRLAARGATRLKVGYATDAARDLYVGAGFRITTTDQTYRRPE